MKDSFSMDQGDGGYGLEDESSALYLLCTLFLYLLHQLYLRLSGIKSQRLGTLSLESIYTVDYQVNFYDTQKIHPLFSFSNSL